MMWYENKIYDINGLDIYLKKDKFLDICKKLNVNTSDSLLEIYEEFGLLFPIYRVIRPHDYLQEIFEQNNANDLENVIKVSDQYGELLKFENEELLRWHIPIFIEFEKTIIDGHPLDQAFKKSLSFIQKPSRDNFHKWDEYKVNLETPQKKQTRRHADSIAVVYYSPWQIYLLDEANVKHTYEINVLLNDFSKPFLSNTKPQKLETLEYNRYFETMWKYKFIEAMLFLKYSHNSKNCIIEGENYKHLYDEQITIATNISSIHTYEEWIRFLRYLCFLYYNYQNREKLKLSQCVKKDIGGVIDLLMYGLEKKYKQIVDDIGNYIGTTTYMEVPPLERIYPEYENFLKRESKPLLESVLKNYNEEVPEDLQLNEDAIDKIINHALSIGNETLLVSVISLNNEYFSPSYFGNEGIWTHIRSLCVSVESWVKVHAERSDFKEAIIKLATGDFDFCCNELCKNCGTNKLVILTINDLKKYLDKLKQINLIKKGKYLSWMKSLLRAYIIRNYAAHQTKLEPGLFGTNLIELYRSLLFFVFYAWKVKNPTITNKNPEDQG